MKYRVAPRIDSSLEKTDALGHGKYYRVLPLVMPDPFGNRLSWGFEVNWKSLGS